MEVPTYAPGKTVKNGLESTMPQSRMTGRDHIDRNREFQTQRAAQATGHFVSLLQSSLKTVYSVNESFGLSELPSY